MGFRIYFLNTFPSPALLEPLFRLFNLISWRIDSVHFEETPLKELLKREENQIIISPFVGKVSVDNSDGFTKIVLPLSYQRWEDIGELLRGDIKVFRTYPEEFPPTDIPAGGRFFLNERELSFIGNPPLEGRDFYTSRGESLEEVVGKLLKERGLTLSTAESCTGGMVAAALVNVAGSSEYFIGSVVAYSNEVKEKVLGVKRETLERYGAVSAQTAAEMAQGVRKLLKTDIGISTTGIAGPSGGTKEKPVGLTYFGIAIGDKTLTFKRIFPFGRNQNRLSATYYLLFKLYGLLKEV